MPDIGVEAAVARQKLEEKLQGMSFLAHLEELRMRIVKSLIAVACGFFVCFWKADAIYNFMMVPIMQALKHNGLDQKLVYLNPTEPFNMYLKIGLIAGLFVASPYVLYQVWAFIAPGLYRHEKRYVLPFMVSTVFLFLAGGYFGYRVVYPAALDFLVSYGKQFQPMITIGEYTDLFLTIIIGLGLIFEMPILAFFLSLMGVISAGFLWKNLRYSILGIFIIAAIVTPTSDIMNMCLFAAPMIVLYLLSVLVAWLAHPKRRKAKAEAQLKA
ncbi:MAG: twin-arginine translocase subunit TatC [Terriglobales bacterium]